LRKKRGGKEQPLSSARETKVRKPFGIISVKGRKKSHTISSLSRGKREDDSVFCPPWAALRKSRRGKENSKNSTFWRKKGEERERKKISPSSLKGVVRIFAPDH